MVDTRTGAVVLGFLAFVLVDEAAELEDTLELQGAAVVCEEPVLKGALEDDDTAEVWTVLKTEDDLKLEGTTEVWMVLVGTADVFEELVLNDTDDTTEVLIVLEIEDVLELDARLEEEGTVDELSVLLVELATDVSMDDCELED